MKTNFYTPNPLKIKILYAAGILSWLLVVWGYVNFLKLNTWYALVFGPCILILTAYYLISYGINLFYKRFDISTHEKKVNDYWKTHKEASVDIFIPVCGEPLEVIFNTVRAAKYIDYKNKEIFVLDDKGSDEVKTLAKQLGATYLSRPNKGEMKKAGNLKYGYEHSSGEFIVIFDADFVAEPQFIKELLPYMEDRKVGIVQSPQYFDVTDEVYKRSQLAYAAGYVQEDFYRLIQQSREQFGGAICVGSNAVYRRKALEAIGGPVQIEHSEDVYTGFNMLLKGYTLKYLPLILAKGLCPDSLRSYFSQQYRWCAGSMSLLLSKKFWRSPLTKAQKLCFSSGFLYYLSYPIAIVLSVQLFVLLARHFDQITFERSLPFLPYLIFTFIVLPLSRTVKPKLGVAIARTAHIYSYTIAIISTLLGKNLEWQPSGTLVKKSVHFSLFTHLPWIVALSYGLLGMAMLAWHGFLMFAPAYIVITFWIGLYFATNIQLLYGLIKEM